MATESKDVELRVRARDYSQKTLNDVTKALDDLSKAQAQQLAAAAKGEVSAKALADSYTKIENAVKALISQNSITKTFEANEAALDKARAAADKAREAYRVYADSMAGVGEKSRKQIADQQKLADAVARTEKAQRLAEDRLARTTAKLAEFGIAANQVKDAQARMAAGVEAGNAALALQERALDSVEADIARNNAAQKAAAAAAQEAAAKQAAANKLVADSAAAAAAGRYRLLAIEADEAKAAADQQRANKLVADSMRQAAQQAEATAKGYQTLARSVKSVRGDDLANQLRAIISPSEVALETLGGLDAAVNRLGATVGAINGPVKNFKATLQELQAVQSGVGAIGASIDAYKRQIDVLRATRNEYAQARGVVTALTAQMKAGGGDAESLSAALNRAQSALGKAAQAMSTQVSKTRELRDALRGAGVDTSDLASAEQKLVTQATTATGVVERLTAAFKQYGAAAENAGKGQFKFFDSTRTTLSFAQRLRGEIIGLTTAYVGLNAVIGVAKDALSVANEVTKIEGQLGAAFGNDAKTIKEQWDYLMDAANRLGISFKEAAPAYGKFAIAAKSFGFNGQDIKDVFEGLAKASRVAGLSAADFEGVLKAVEQMLSKGTIQAEELRGQLGDRLPGAFTLLASSMGVTTTELGKLLEKGEVGAENLLPFVDSLGQKFQYTEKQVNSLQAAQSTYNNALFEFQKAIGDSGFTETFTKFLNELAAFLKGSDGQKLASTLGSAFSTIVEGLRYLLQNIEQVKVALSILLGLSVARWAKVAFEGLFALFGIFGELATVVRTVTGLFGGAEAAVGTLGAAAVGTTTVMGRLGASIVSLAKLLPTLSSIAAGAYAATRALLGLQDTQNNLAGRTASGKITEADGKTPVVIDPKKEAEEASARTMGPKRAAEKAAKEAEERQKKLDKDRKGALKKQAKDELGERADLIKDEYQLLREQARTNIKDEKLASEAILKIDAQEKQALETDRIRYDAEHAKAGAAAANKEVTLREKVKNELLKIQDDLAKQETKQDQTSSFEERKATRLQAISHQYDKLKKDIATLSTLDKGAADEAKKKLDVYIGQLQAVEGVKATTDEIKRLEKELTDQQQLRESLLKVQKDQYDAGLISQEEFLRNTAEINKTADTAVVNAANNLQTFVDAAVKAKAGILSLTEQADVKAKTTGAISGAAGTNNKIQDAQNQAAADAVDALVAKRDAAEAIYRKQLELRSISEDEYAAKSNANADQYRDKILELNNALIAQLETQRALGILEGTLNPQRLAALDAEIAKRQLLGTTVKDTQNQLDLFGKTLSQSLSSGIDTALNGLVDAMTKLAQGTISTGEAFKQLGTTVLQVFAQMLQQIAMAIAKQLILNALANSGGVVGQAAAAAGGVVTRHSGGRIGGNMNGIRRNVDPGWFTNAPRFHSGGFPGLRNDEVPAILQTGEQVLARDDPNNVLNGSPTATRNRPSPGTRVVLVDDRAKVPEAMQSAEGENVIIQTLKRNASTVKQIAR